MSGFVTSLARAIKLARVKAYVLICPPQKVQKVKRVKGPALTPAHTFQYINTATMNNEEDNRRDKHFFLAQLITKFPAAKVAMTAVICVMAWYFAIPTMDVVFAIFFSAYLILANILRFQSNAPARKNEKEINLFLLKEDDVFPWFSIYMIVFASAGVALPAATLLLAPDEAKSTIAPHLFLLLTQIHMEGVTNDVRYHNVIRLLVPIGFNTYRMSSLFRWVEVAWKNNASLEGCWYYCNIGLAVVNLILWAYNLFVFLLLRVAPAYFDPVVSPAAPVVWKGQVFPVVQEEKKKE